MHDWVVALLWLELGRGGGVKKFKFGRFLIPDRHFWMTVSLLFRYAHQHGKEMSAPAIGQMLATTLYSRRFFPFYTFNVVGGLDENGEVR